MKTNWLKLYLGHRAKKFGDKLLMEAISKPWDGKIESLPHFRGCQCLRGSHFFGPFECDCGISSCAAHSKGWFRTLLIARYKSYATYLGRFVHPIRLYRDLKSIDQTPLFFRELWVRLVLGIHSAKTLYWVEAPDPNLGSADAYMRQKIAEYGLSNDSAKQSQEKMANQERS